MVATNNTTRGRLVTLRPGRYWKVHSVSRTSPTLSIDIDNPTSALLLEFQGKQYNSDYVPNNEACWHALVGGNVILVWESHFHVRPENKI